MNDVDQLNVLRNASGKIRSALIWAERAHRGQKRSADVPYVLHPIAVATVLAAAGADRDLVCAGCLHDVLEDTPVTAEQMREEFGAEVTRLVQAVTKPAQNRPRLEKQAELVSSSCREVGVDALALKAADLLVNLTDLVHGCEQDGPSYWESVFGARRWSRKLDHYEQLAELLCSDEALCSRYPALVKALAERRAELAGLRST